MELTFGYDVNAVKAKVLIAQVTFKEDMTVEETARLLASYREGKYTYLNEDDAIRDIYDRIHEMAMQTEKQQDYGDQVGTVVMPENFAYPPELANM